MADTPQRAQAARSYLDMLGIRPRRRRAPVDVEMGQAAIEAPDEETRALELLADADARARGTQAPTPTTTPEGVPPEWLAQVSPEAQMGASVTRQIGEAQTRRHDRERSAAYDRGVVEGLVTDADNLDAINQGVVQGLTFGGADELGGAVRSGAWHPFGDAETGEAYRMERDRLREAQDKAQREAPGLYAGAEFLGSIPSMMAIPGAGPGASLTQRVLTSSAIGTGAGALSGSGHSRADWRSPEFRGDVARDAAIGGTMGAGSELLMAGGQRLRDFGRAAPAGTPRPGGDFTPEQRAQAEQRLDAGDPDVFDQMTTRDALEDAAATRRVRSTADSAALSDVRRAGDYHGPGGEGYRGLARDLDATGISPRGSLTSSRTAQQRASRIENQAGREIGGVSDEMVARVRPDDMSGPPMVIDDLERQVHLPVDESTGRQSPRAASRLDDTIREQNPATGAPRRDPSRPIDFADETPMTPEDIDRGGLETRAAVNQRADPARVRYSGDVMRQDHPYRVELTPANTSARIRAEAAEAAQSATTREQHAAAAQLNALADDIDRLPPEDFAAAQRRLRALDDEAAYGTRYPNAPGATPERTNRARTVRGGVRADMDEAVRNTLGEEALQRYQAARGRFGAARSVGVLSERGAAREASNLQAGLGDTLGIHGGLNRDPNAGPVQRVWNAVEGVVVNRYLRGMGHTTVAALQEFQSDAMARDIVRRLSEQPVTQPMARALAEAQRRGPRAFGVALIALSRESPEVQEAVTNLVSASPDYQALGLPTADEPLDAGTDMTDVDWRGLGLGTADDYEEEQR